MFSGNNTIIFSTNHERSSVLSSLEDELTAIGRVTFNGDRQFIIDGSAYSSALHHSKIEGSIREKDGKYQLFLDYSSGFTTLGWIVFIICVLLWLIGLLWLLMPANAKGSIRKKAERVFESIRFNYK